MNCFILSWTYFTLLWVLLSVLSEVRSDHPAHRSVVSYLSTCVSFHYPDLSRLLSSLLPLHQYLTGSIPELLVSSWYAREWFLMSFFSSEIAWLSAFLYKFCKQHVKSDIKQQQQKQCWSLAWPHMPIIPDWGQGITSLRPTLGATVRVCPSNSESVS